VNRRFGRYELMLAIGALLFLGSLTLYFWLWFSSLSG
jgi:hypothetical protein